MPEEPQRGVEPAGDPSARERSTETQAAPRKRVMLPKMIGRFHVKDVLASGGMGTVFRAIQEHPRRTVAVKVMRHGIASRSAMRRFEYESQILARLRHPGIAQVYEAGTHDDGTGDVPFFAMEYIPNAKSITQYAKEKKLGTRAQLGLLAHVCDAVHHGHQKGIIHRDLKPGNILVDSHGEVKIIDFGVARGTDSDMAVTTLQTDIGQLIGTLQYMSPEQCEADPDDIDTRSDVYALGVVLYELVSGRLPYNVSSKRVFDSTRIIREQEPTKLTTIDKALRGDVETIVLKALEKDRDRRYQSADELRRDIEHYLKGEPISARPPSMVYQLKVFARRNKALVGGVLAVFVALSVGLVVSTSLYLRAERAKQEAENERRRTLLAEKRVTQERRRAEAAEDRAAALLTAQQGIGKKAPSFTLTTLDGQTVGSADFVNRPATVLIFSAANCPFSMRAIHNLIPVRTDYGRKGVRFIIVAETFKGKRYNTEDLTTLFTGHGWDWELTLDGQNRIGRLFNARGYPAVVVVDRGGMIRDVSRGNSEQLGQLLAGLTKDQPVRSGGTVCDVPPPPHPADLDVAAMEQLLRRRLEVQRRVLGGDAPGTLEAMSTLAGFLMPRGEYREAEQYYQHTLKVLRSAGTEGHAFAAAALDGLTRALRAQNREDEAQAEARAFAKEQLERQALAMTEGPQTLNEYAWSLLTVEPAELRDPQAALPIAKKAVELSKNDPMILDTLALAYQMTGHIDEAIETQRKAAVLIPPGEVSLLTELETRLSEFIWEKGDSVAAESAYREILARRQALLPAGHADIAPALYYLGLATLEQAKYAEAEALLRECLSIRERTSPADHRHIGNAKSALGASLAGQGRLSDAEPLLLDGYKQLKDNADTIPDSIREIALREALKRIVSLYEAWDKPDKAAEYQAMLPKPDQGP